MPDAAGRRWQHGPSTGEKINSLDKSESVVARGVRQEPDDPGVAAFLLGLLQFSPRHHTSGHHQ